MNWYKKFLKIASFRNKTTVLSKKISNYAFENLVKNINAVIKEEFPSQFED